MWSSLFSDNDEVEDVVLTACMRADCPACGDGGAAQRALIEQARANSKALTTQQNDIYYKGECNHCGAVKGQSQFYPKDWKALEHGFTAHQGQVISGTDRKAIRPFNHATPRGMCKTCYDTVAYWR